MICVYKARRGIHLILICALVYFNKHETIGKQFKLMKALFLKDQLLLENIPVPVPQKDEALVKVSMAGICNTDLELIKGYMGFQGVLGHEFVGVVESANDKDWVGKRVCGEINFGCGKCDICRKGLSRHCPERTVLGILNQNGAFAEYVLLPVENLHVVPEAIPNEHAVFVEPVAAALEILEQIKIEPDHKVAVIGDGKLGLLICQVLRLSGADIHLFGKHERKLKLATKWKIRTHFPEEPLENVRYCGRSVRVYFRFFHCLKCFEAAWNDGAQKYLS